MNTFQIIQLAMTVTFAISAIVVGFQSSRYAKQAQAHAARAEAAAQRAEAARRRIEAIRNGEAL